MVFPQFSYGFPMVHWYTLTLSGYKLDPDLVSDLGNASKQQDTAPQSCWPGKGTTSRRTLRKNVIWTQRDGLDSDLFLNGALLKMKAEAEMDEK